MMKHKVTASDTITVRKLYVVDKTILKRNA